MRHFVLLLLVASAQSDTHSTIPREVAASLPFCLFTQGISEETFATHDWRLSNDSELVRSMAKCITEYLGLFDANVNAHGGFRADRMVKQFGGESVRERVEKCIDDNPIVAPANKSVRKVMQCLEDDNLKLYSKILFEMNEK